MLSIDSIDSAKHVVISLPKDFDAVLAGSSSALYSYILTRHKKVSLYCQNSEVSSNLHFLPWMDKLKSSYPSSADLELKLENSEEVFSFFESNKIKLNSKMATSLYASLIAQSEGYTKDTDIRVFTLASELLEAGADVKSCNRYILNYNSLAGLRLKAILLKKMVLIDSAQSAFIELEDKDLKSSGASLEDSRVVIKDALSLPTVNRVIVKYKNKEIINEGEMV